MFPIDERVFSENFVRILSTKNGSEKTAAANF